LTFPIIPSFLLVSGISQETVFEDASRRAGSSRRSRTPSRPLDSSTGGVSLVPSGGTVWTERLRQKYDDKGSSEDEESESSRSATLTSCSEGSASPDPPSSRPRCGVERGQSEPEDEVEEVDEEEVEDEDNGEEDGEEEIENSFPGAGADPPAFIIRPPAASDPQDLSGIPLPPGRCRSFMFLLVVSCESSVYNLLSFFSDDNPVVEEQHGDSVVDGGDEPIQLDESSASDVDGTATPDPFGSAFSVAFAPSPSG
jgi:hypothetical protein